MNIVAESDECEGNQFVLRDFFSSLCMCYFGCVYGQARPQAIALHTSTAC